jgi:hypothetical protein
VGYPKQLSKALSDAFMFIVSRALPRQFEMAPGGKMSSHFMNPAVGRHMTEGRKAMSETDSAHGGTEKGGKAGSKMPQMHIHTHSKGHTVHVMHANGKHEQHEHAHGDTEGMKAHIDQHFGSGEAAPTPPEAEPPVEPEPEEQPAY